MCVLTRFWALRGDDQQCEKWQWVDVDVFLFAWRDANVQRLVKLYKSFHVSCVKLGCLLLAT